MSERDPQLALDLGLHAVNQAMETLVAALDVVPQHSRRAAYVVAFGTMMHKLDGILAMSTESDRSVMLALRNQMNGPDVTETVREAMRREGLSGALPSDPDFGRDDLTPR